MIKGVTLGTLVLLLSLSAVKMVPARHGGQAQSDTRMGSQAKPVAAEEERGRLLATGKKIFVERCGEMPRRARR
jgi:hypothetical protein